MKPEQAPWPAAGAQPLPAHHCPLCGAPNHCAAAREMTFDTPCWCTTLYMPAELLAQVPEALRGRACICRACVERWAAERGSQA